MCGIAGFWGKGTDDDVLRMINAVRHRGPDDSGIFSDHALHLAHRRLSIIDLSPAGHQPMHSQDGLVTVVYNGEIYNFKEHRERLARAGYNFRGSSDTEVILALYEEVGEKCFEYLDGMFALALWDSRQQKLLLARDRMGKKPLYWGIFNDTLVFGSELKAVLAHPQVTKELSTEALALYLAHEYIPTPLTPFTGIFKLRPATYLRYQNGEVKEQSFWNTSFLQREPLDRPLRDSLVELDQLIDQATKERLVSDVPLGLLLSGGLDSSTVAYYAARALKERGQGPLRTFSIGFKEAGFDESDYAARVAVHLGTQHQVRMCTADDALALLPELASSLDEPLADTSILPTSLLSRFAREEVTVALGGDGGDELFLGYGPFLAHKVADSYSHIPSLLHRLFNTVANLLPTSHRYLSFDFKVKRFLRGANLPVMERDQAWMGAFQPAEISNLLSPEQVRRARDLNLFKIHKSYFAEVVGDTLRRLSWLYARTYMMDYVMVKADRASMLASLELRSPLLATRLVEFVYSLPTENKLHGRTGKYILKKLMEDKLPRDIVYRPKKGFGAPVGVWLRGPLLPLLKEKLSRERIAKQGLFNPAAVDKLVLEHESGAYDRRKELWTLLMFQLWYDAWYE